MHIYGTAYTGPVIVIRGVHLGRALRDCSDKDSCRETALYAIEGGTAKKLEPMPTDQPTLVSF
jgi:hypothetical protein